MSKKYGVDVPTNQSIFLLKKYLYGQVYCSNVRSNFSVVIWVGPHEYFLRHPQEVVRYFHQLIETDC